MTIQYYEHDCRSEFSRRWSSDLFDFVIEVFAGDNVVGVFHGSNNNNNAYNRAFQSAMKIEGQDRMEIYLYDLGVNS